MYSRFWTRVTDILGASLIGRFYLAIVHGMANSFHNSWLYSFFTGKNMQSYGSSSVVAGKVRKILFKSKLTDFIAQSAIVRGICVIPEKVMASSILIVSAYMLPCGIVMFIRHFGDVQIMLYSALIMLIGVLSLNLRETVGSVFGRSALLGGLCRFFDIRTDYPKSEKKLKKCITAIVLGLIAGGTSFFLSTKLSFIVFAAFLVLPIIIASPLLLITLTFLAGIMFSTLPATIIAALTLIVVICRLFTKRESLPPLRSVYILVILYSAVTLYYAFNGFGGNDSILAGIIQFLFLAVFFCIVVVINNFDKFRKLIYAISACSLLTGFLGIYQKIAGIGGTGWTSDEDYVGGLIRISSTFMNPNVYGEFLIFIICVSISAFLISDKLFPRLFFAGCFAIQMFNLALTYSRGCYIAIFISVLIMIWCCDKRLLGFGIFAIPFVPYVLPKNIITRIVSVGSYLKDSSVTYRFSIWFAGWRIIKNYWFLGSGIGTLAFTAFYQNFMRSGVPAQHAHNLLMQITIELSIVGTFLIISILIFAIKDISHTLSVSGTLKNKFILVPLIASFAGIMIEGLVDYVFYNNIVFLVFWMVLAIFVSGLNICGTQHELAADK